MSQALVLSLFSLTTGNDVNGYLMQMVSEIIDGCTQSRRPHRWSFPRDLPGHLSCFSVEFRKASALGRVSYDDEVIPSDIAPSGRLNGNFETFLDDFRLYGTCQVKPFPDCTSRCK